MTIACLLIHENITREFNGVIALPVGRERKNFACPKNQLGRRPRYYALLKQNDRILQP